MLKHIPHLVLALALNGLVVPSLMPRELFGIPPAMTLALLVTLCQLIYAFRHGGGWSFARALAPVVALLFEIVVLAQSYWLQNPRPEYGLWKLEAFIAFAAAPTLLILFNYYGHREATDLLLRWLLAATFVPVLVLLFAPRLDFTYGLRWFLTSQQLDPIGVGRTLGVGSVLAFGLSWRVRGLKRILLLLCVGFFAVGSIETRERGPVVALLVALLYISATPLCGRGRHLERRLIGTGIILLITYAGVTLLAERITHSALESDGRIVIIQSAWIAITGSPAFGTGLGAFYFDGGLGTHYYAHNIVIEFLVETGVVGLVPFLAFLYLTLRVPSRTRELPAVTYVCRALFLFVMVAAQVSGDIAANCFVFAAAALVLCSSSVIQTSSCPGRLALSLSLPGAGDYRESLKTVYQ